MYINTLLPFGLLYQPKIMDMLLGSSQSSIPLCGAYRLSCEF